MNDKIQVGIPCLDEQLCFWAGIAFGVVVLMLVLYFMFSAYRERQNAFKKRRERQAKRKNKDDAG